MPTFPTHILIYNTSLKICTVALCFFCYGLVSINNPSQIAKFMGPTWGPPWSCRPQMGPMLAPQTLLSGLFSSVSFLWCWGNGMIDTVSVKQPSGIFYMNTLSTLKTKIIHFTTLSSLLALWVVITTTYCATSDDKVVKLMIFCFRCTDDMITTKQSPTKQYAYSMGCTVP